MLSDDSGVFMNTKQGFKRLVGFSKFEFDSGAQSYIRQYFSGNEKSVDIAGSIPVISYVFDRMINNSVHGELAEIAEFCFAGDEAVKEFIFVDFSEDGKNRFPALKQSFAVKARGKNTQDAFLSYSGNLIGRKKPEKGYFIADEDFMSGEFISERGGILCD